MISYFFKDNLEFPFRKKNQKITNTPIINQKSQHLPPMKRSVSTSGAGHHAIVCLCLMLLGCGGDKESIVQEKVAERVTAFKEKKRAECRESLLLKAEKTVDSLLLTEAQQALNDSLSRLRPGRPFQPAPVPPIDSLSVKPIFEGIRPASPTGQ